MSTFSFSAPSPKDSTGPEGHVQRQKKGSQMICCLIKMVVSAELCTSVFVAYVGGKFKKMRTLYCTVFDEWTQKKSYTKENIHFIVVYVRQFLAGLKTRLPKTCGHM